MSTPKRVSIIPPPPAAGTFKIEKTEVGTIIATPTKDGKPTAKPTHACNQDRDKWTPMFGTSPPSLLLTTGRKLSIHESRPIAPKSSPDSFAIKFNPATPPVPLAPVSSPDSSEIKFPKIKSTTHTSAPSPITSTKPSSSSPDNDGMEQLLQALLH